MQECKQKSQMCFPDKKWQKMCLVCPVPLMSSDYYLSGSSQFVQMADSSPNRVSLKTFDCDFFKINFLISGD